MPKAKRDPIPRRFPTLEAAGAFWDAHDLGEYWDQTEEATAMSFRLERRRHLVAIEPGLARDLHAALERGVSPETIANLWLREMLAKSQGVRRRPRAS